MVPLPDDPILLEHGDQLDAEKREALRIRHLNALFRLATWLPVVAPQPTKFKESYNSPRRVCCEKPRNFVLNLPILS